MNTAWTLAGKRALITGGTRGIGAATVDEFLALGAEVAIVSREAHKRDGVFAIQADVSDAADRARIAEELGAHWDRLDVLVNNAGMNIRKPWAEISDAERDIVLNTNALGPMDLTKRLLPLLQKSNPASIVNVASVAGFVDVGSGATYALSKAAMTEAAAMGLLRRDVPTDELAILLSGLTDATIFAWARAGCPAGLRAKADPLFDFFLHGAKAP